MTKDRNYYRQLSNGELVEHTKEIKPTELELVLAERLKRAMQKLEDRYYDRKADEEGY